MDYKTAWDYQEKLLQENVDKKAAVHSRESSVVSPQSSVASHAASDLGLPTSDVDTQHYLLLVEHPPVYTLGKSGKIENVLISEELRSAK